MNKIQEAIDLATVRVDETKAKAAEVLAQRNAAAEEKKSRVARIQEQLEEFFTSEEFMSGQKLVALYEEEQAVRYDSGAGIWTPSKVCFNPFAYSGVGYYTVFRISDKQIISGSNSEAPGTPPGSEISLADLSEALSRHGTSSEDAVEGFKSRFRRRIEDVMKSYLPPVEVEVPALSKTGELWFWIILVIVVVAAVAYFS